MRHLFITFLVMSSYSVSAEIHRECLNEAVEVAIAYKISAIAEGECSSIDKDGFMSIGEDRISKKRFLNSAVKGLDAGEKIPSRLFSSFEHTGEDVELDKSTICPVVSKRTQLAAKEMMKDCPGGAELFQYILGKQKESEKISDVPLSTACHKVEELKKRACDESKTVYKAAGEAQITAPSSAGGTSARASAQ